MTGADMTLVDSAPTPWGAGRPTHPTCEQWTAVMTDPRIHRFLPAVPLGAPLPARSGAAS